MPWESPLCSRWLSTRFQPQLWGRGVRCHLAHLVVGAEEGDVAVAHGGGVLGGDAWGGLETRGEEPLTYDGHSAQRTLPYHLPRVPTRPKEITFL